MQGIATDLLTPIRSVVLDSDAVTDAEVRLIALGVPELFVISAEGRLLGILPDYEVLKRRLVGDLRSLRVSDLMSPAAVQITCQTPLAELAERMRLSCHRRLPVVDDGRLVGEVTRRSLLRHLQASERSQQNPRRPSAGSVPAHRPFGPPKFLSSSRPTWTAAQRVAFEG